MTRFFAIVENPRTGAKHRIGQTRTGGIVFITHALCTTRTFGAEDKETVWKFAAGRGWRVWRWRAINPYPWLVLDSDTRWPHPNLARALNRLAARMGRKLFVNEGTRTRARQQALYDAGVRRYGYPEVLRWVARPGTSNHEDRNGDGYANAADVQDAVDGENLLPMMQRRGITPASVGLKFPMAHEPWHVEPA